MKRTGPTNPYLRELIKKLREKYVETKAAIWRDVAEKLERPRRKRVEINLRQIDRHAKENDVILVPGVVLGDGKLTKPLTIVAWRFSKSAAKKIEEAGGKVMEIEELMKINPNGSNVRIMV